MMRIKNPDIHYPDTLVLGTVEDLMTYDIKKHKKKEENQGTITLYRCLYSACHSTKLII